jgi:hypothetical protein
MTWWHTRDHLVVLQGEEDNSCRNNQEQDQVNVAHVPRPEPPRFGSGYFRCRILARIRRFFRPTLRRPLLFLISRLPFVNEHPLFYQGRPL